MQFCNTKRFECSSVLILNPEQRKSSSFDCQANGSVFITFFKNIVQFQHKKKSITSEFAVLLLGFVPKKAGNSPFPILPFGSEHVFPMSSLQVSSI